MLHYNTDDGFLWIGKPSKNKKSKKRHQYSSRMLFHQRNLPQMSTKKAKNKKTLL